MKNNRSPDIVLLKMSNQTSKEYTHWIRELTDYGFVVKVHSILNGKYLDSDAEEDLDNCKFILSWKTNASEVRLIAQEIFQSWVLIDPVFEDKNEDQWCPGCCLCSSEPLMKSVREYTNKPIINLQDMSFIESIQEFLNHLPT
jgi:hypothetical protein